MRYVAFFILCFSLVSCNYFDKKKVSTEEILQEDLKTFNWNEVDEYPSFAVCDSSSTKELRKQCFQTTLTEQITSQLVSKRLVVTKPINDTIAMKFLVSEKGVITILETLVNENIKSQIPEIEIHLQEIVKQLPAVSPAIKRGQQVKTEFTLPIVVLTN